MKSNMIAKGLLTAAVAGLVAGAIAPTTAFAAKKKAAKHACGKDGCKSAECKAKKDHAKKDNGCSGKNGCNAADMPAEGAPADDSAPADNN